jgi:hypothetical protein
LSWFAVRSGLTFIALKINLHRPVAQKQACGQIGANGGDTNLDNLVLLCRHHHRLMHEGGFACEKSDTGRLIFRNETGKVICNSGSVPKFEPNPLAQKRIQTRLEELFIEAGTCVAQWEGERVDYGLATELLWDREFPDD